MAKTIFTRYVNDPTTAEQELHQRSGQTVELVGEPFDADPGNDIMMQHIRFEDGYEDDAFVDELTPKGTPTARKN